MFPIVCLYISWCLKQYFYARMQKYSLFRKSHELVVLVMKKNKGKKPYLPYFCTYSWGHQCCPMLCYGRVTRVSLIFSRLYTILTRFLCHCQGSKEEVKWVSGVDEASSLSMRITHFFLHYCCCLNTGSIKDPDDCVSWTPAPPKDFQPILI